MNNEKIASFTDLNTWKEGHKLVLGVYKATTEFPKEEKFSLTDQLRRAAVSITSNIAEGFSRQYYREKVQSYSISLGSLTEVQNQLLVARDLGYINKIEFETIANQTIAVQKLLRGLIRSSRKQNSQF